MEIVDNNKFLGITFRNRLEFIKKEIIAKKNLDAIIIILCKKKLIHDKITF
jgi:hypothetical protein